VTPCDPFLCLSPLDLAAEPVCGIVQPSVSLQVPIHEKQCKSQNGQLGGKMGEDEGGSRGFPLGSSDVPSVPVHGSLSVIRYPCICKSTC
jgi:hypothetical protein